MGFGFPLSVVVPQQVALYFKVLLCGSYYYMPTCPDYFVGIGAALNIGNSIGLLLWRRLKRMVLIFTLLV
jgi:hypothetical protein